MIFIYYVIFFLLGAIVSEFIVPIFDSLTSLLLTWLEEKKHKIGVRIAKLQISMEQPQELTPACGFEWIDDNEDEEDDEEND